MGWGMQGAAGLARAGMCPPAESLLFCAWSYKRVKGRSHTVEKLNSMNQTPCNQPAAAVHTHAQTQHRLTAQLLQPPTAPHTHVSS